MSDVRFAVQFWFRQSRRASFRLLFLALVLAVAAISSVGVFSARLEAALLRDATQMLGGDLVVESKRDIANASWISLTQQDLPEGVKTASSVVFPSVVPSAQTDLLVSLKAVSVGYPLRGELTVRSAKQPEEKITSGPSLGEAWVDESVLPSLGIGLGDSISVGEARLKVTRVILVEPDRNPGFVNFAPRVMVNTADLEATRLLGPGSRATWRAYFAGSNAKIAALRETLEPQMSNTEELETVEGGRPEVYGTLSRAKDFLAMSALIGTLVACVGIALVSHLFAKEQSTELAVLKSLGFTPRHLLRLWLTGLMGLTLVSGLAGVTLGWLAHWGLMALLADLVGVQLPMAGLIYLPAGIGLAGLLLLGFAAVPAWYALKAPAVAVLRKQSLSSDKLLLGLSMAFGLTTTVAMCLLIVKNQTLAFTLVAGFVAVCLAFAGLFWLLLRALAKFDQRRSALGQGGRISVFQSMSKRSGTLILQGVSLSLGLSALLILAVVQGDLIDRWQAVVPNDAPNRFVFNIQPDQVGPLEKSLENTLQRQVELYPMVRGRLSGIRGETITANTFANPDAKRMVEREFNLSFTDQLPKLNTVEQGEWFKSNTASQGEAEVSIENSIAERLNIKLGDELAFDIAGTPLTAKVTSVRDLRWDSMEVNFYVIFPPKVLKDFPQTWITAFYVEPGQATALSRDLVRTYPNLTVLDTALVISQIRKILGKVSQAVQFIFLFTVGAGGLVVVACVLTGARSRTRESAIYRALGASTSQLQKAAWTELATIGALAGLVSALVAQALGWAVARYVFEFEYMISPSNVLMGVAGGIAVSVLFGAWSVRRVCLAPVMSTLRQAAV
jgi:putative ABC transport system permease protein